MRAPAVGSCSPLAGFIAPILINGALGRSPGLRGVGFPRILEPNSRTLHVNYPSLAHRVVYGRVRPLRQSRTRLISPISRDEDMISRNHCGIAAQSLSTFDYVLSLAKEHALIHIPNKDQPPELFLDRKINERNTLKDYK
ncbi:hypothetical protein TcasGA2_TC014324 [Tribolium castaneum]|uniref:Uncharacterized protein n=1 Tax=Tribolium castaneum TaxID=7070 RepID=D6WLB3_TRICA|nr:hypothetical protein TcasGA2_TC014324 [Tribolium castaneum]